MNIQDYFDCDEYMCTGVDPTGGCLGPDFDPETGKYLYEIEEEETAASREMNTEDWWILSGAVWSAVVGSEKFNETVTNERSMNTSSLPELPVLEYKGYRGPLEWNRKDNNRIYGVDDRP